MASCNDGPKKSTQTAQSCHEAVPSHGVLEKKKKHNNNIQQQIHLLKQIFLPPFCHSVSLGAPAKDGTLEGGIQQPAESGWNPAELGTEEFPGSQSHHQTRNQVAQWPVLGRKYHKNLIFLDAKRMQTTVVEMHTKLQPSDQPEIETGHLAFE